MGERIFIKGNEAIAKAAVLAGCDAFFGYPITPSSEIPETLAIEYEKGNLPIFLQTESEIAAINMVMGVASCGGRAMTASSSPGISLKQEGISYLVGMELPAVIVNVNRGGPGLGNIGPEQSDYNQATKTVGHGSGHMVVLAPNSVQEMAEFTMEAFNIADRYRNPVMILTDGYLGQMKEDIVFPEPRVEHYDKSGWATTGAKGREPHIISSIRLSHDELEEHVSKTLKPKFDLMEKKEVRYEEHLTEDAEILLIAFGTPSRVVRDAIERARAKGVKAGLLRPQTLWPFPKERLRQLGERVQAMICVELNLGQMVDDVRLAVSGSCPVELLNRVGGNLPSEVEVIQKIVEVANRLGVTR
ncbi:MAG: 3-methyl-2-oxobutanoate dehydrogenase subunit beta [Methanobacteriota archaeon]|nr:MAG: 3-methyl-2-oxobutanoate dehydrogenase subunit beta [Euryarchaeota archaeon]